MGKIYKVNDIIFSSTLGQVTYTGLNSIKTFKIIAKENLTLSFTNDLLYNDGSTVSWNLYEADTELELSNGDIVVFKGSLVPTEDGIGTFTVSGNFEISGNLLELINYEHMRPYQFKNLFKNCTTLIDASNLNLPNYVVDNCYEGLFYGCTSLETSPILKSEILATDCYKDMFYGCSSLSHIICHNISDISEYVSSDWIYGVASSGIFEIDYTGNWNNTNKASHIPTNWEIDDEYNYPWENSYMFLEVLTDGTIIWKQTGTDARGIKTISYSKDNGTNWTDITATTEGIEINVLTGDKVLIKGSNTYYAYDKNNYSSFTGGTATYNAKGNMMSMLYGDNYIGQTALTASWALSQVFNSSNVVSAEYLIMPATILTDDCYRATFAHCQLMIKSPKILPAITLSTDCYYYMFQDCPLMETHPELPAATLVSNCYKGMLSDCPSLSIITCLAQYNISSSTVGNFIINGAGTPYYQNGTFIKHPDAEWPSPTSGNTYAGIPSNWTIINYTE
jgi:hypothetical protein